MNRFFRIACWMAAGLLVMSLHAPASQAQSTRTLTIDSGRVYIDGRAIPQDELPASLNVEDVKAQYRFLGIQRPVIELDGQLYAVTDRLEPVSEEEVRSQQASVILREMSSSTQSLQSSAGAQVQPSAPAQPGAQEKASVREPAVREQPDLQAAHEQYLSEVQRQSRQLYERLVRERNMEAETYELARLVRLLPGGPERQAQIDTLRATLNEIFDLKQENRRREIEQLQRQISELQRTLQQRERVREAMIEQRMQELLGSTYGTENAQE